VVACTRQLLRACQGPVASLPRALPSRAAYRRACRTERPTGLAHPLARAQPGQPARRHVLAVPRSFWLHSGPRQPPSCRAPGPYRHVHVPQTRQRPPAHHPTRRPGVSPQVPATRPALGLHESTTWWFYARQRCHQHVGYPAHDGGDQRRDSCATSHSRRPLSSLLLSTLGRCAAGQHAGAAFAGSVGRYGLR
jgi:hypothetical protein